MKTSKLASAATLVLGLAASAFSQATVVVHDPTKEPREVKLTAADQAVFDTATAAAKRRISAETCDPEIDFAGFAKGAFTRSGAKQTLVFYQYCQTGNGFGWVGLVLIDGGRVMGNYIAEAGWTVDIETVPDINKNGLDEFTLAYSGGMHQGMGGTGVDLMEFVGGEPKGIGWYKAGEFGPTESASAWKLTAKTGATPLYFKQKYTSGENRPYRKVGANTPAKLGKANTNFSAVK
jgi:hypothetical protein